MIGMKNNVDFDSAAIEKERTQEFYNSAKELSGFINALPLNKEENDTLIKLMIEQVELAEQGAFNQGFKMGVAFADYEAKKSQQFSTNPNPFKML